MKKMKKVVVMWWLALLLLSPAAPGSSAGVSLQEGLYQEEIAGDLDAAMAIYERIIQDASAGRAHAAEAMYRLGMCHLKKENQQQAKALFEQLIARFPDQGSTIKKVQPMLEQMTSPDPATLMPSDTKIYVEIGSPGKQIETILNMLKGTPLANPLAALGGGGKKSPGDMMAALLNPSMMAEFKKIRGIAVGITELRSGSVPLVAVIFPGESDALRGIILAGLGMAGKPGEPIDGMQTVMIGETASVAHDNNVIIVVQAPQPTQRLAWCVKQYKGVNSEPTLASANSSFSQLGRKSREDNALTIWLDGAATFEAIQLASSQDDQLRVIDGFADFKSINDVIAQLSIEQNQIGITAKANFADGHRCLVYDLIRTSHLSKSGFEGVPAAAGAVVSLALSEAQAGQMETAQTAIGNLTGLDVGREIFANMEQITLFAVPPSPETDEIMPGEQISPVLGCIGLAVSRHNPQQTRELFGKLLATADLVASMSANKESSGPASTTAGKYQIAVLKGQPVYCYLGQVGKSTILTLNPELRKASLTAAKAGRSALAGGALQQPLSRLAGKASKLAVVNVGAGIQLARAHIESSAGKSKDPNNPLGKVLAQLAQACEKTTVQFHTAERLNRFELALGISELPPLGEVLPLLMRLSQSVKSPARPSPRRSSARSVRGVYAPDDAKDHPGRANDLWLGRGPGDSVPSLSADGTGYTGTGRALVFDGADDTAFARTWWGKQATVKADFWFQTDVVDRGDKGGQTMVTAQSVWQVNVSYDDVVFSIWTKDSLRSLVLADVVDPNRWQHVSAEVDAAGLMQLTVDEKSTTSAGQPMKIRSVPIQLGTKANTGRWFDGKLDEVKIEADGETVALWHMDSTIEQQGAKPWWAR